MSEQLYCGWSRADITPKVPVSLAGYFNVRIWNKVLDPLEVRAIVFKQNGKYAAVINMDLVSCCQLLVNRIMPKIADLDMFSKENILFCATHTHTGPEIRFSHLPGTEECGEQIAEATSQALRAALADLQVVDGMVQGETYDNRFIFNRRYWMKSGGVVTNPGKFNPDILRPEGTVDPEIPLIGVKRNGKLALLIANIVNHSDTIGGNGVSADWPGFARRTVESQLGEGAMFVPIIGTAGNINHFDVASDLNQTCYAEAERIGTGIGATILNALDSLKPCCEMPLESRFTEVYVPGHEVSDEEYNEALATVEKYKDEPDVSASDDLTSEDLARKLPKVLKHFAKQVLLLREEPKNTTFPLPAIFVNGVALLGVPGEPFVEIGLELRKNIFNDYRTMVAGHGPTGSDKLGGGYMPNVWNYGRGGYETTGRSNPFSHQASVLLLNGYRKMAGRKEQ